jgi:hypothetical protein
VIPEIVLKAEIDQAIRAIENVNKRQLPFATSLAVNETAKAAQQAVRAHVAGAFTLRKPQFILNTVKIEKYDFATKRNPTAFRLKIDDAPTKGGGRRDVLAKFEPGGSKTTLDPTFPIAIPSRNLRPSFAELVPRAMYPGSLRLVPRRGAVGAYYTNTLKGRKRKVIFGTLPVQQKRTKRGVLQWTGKRRTFVLDPREHLGVKTWGVYQRTGRGKDDVQLIWTYKMRIPIPPRLRFVATATAAVHRTFRPNFERAYAHALATARP